MGILQFIKDRTQNGVKIHVLSRKTSVHNKHCTEDVNVDAMHQFKALHSNDSASLGILYNSENKQNNLAFKVMNNGEEKYLLLKDVRRRRIGKKRFGINGKDAQGNKIYFKLPSISESDIRCLLRTNNNQANIGEAKKNINTALKKINQYMQNIAANQMSALDTRFSGGDLAEEQPVRPTTQPTMGHSSVGGTTVVGSPRSDYDEVPAAPNWQFALNTNQAGAAQPKSVLFAQQVPPLASPDTIPTPR